MTPRGQSERWRSRPNWRANMAAANANAMARRYGSTERIRTADVLALWEREPTCQDCGEGVGLDHIEPLRLGGRNHPENLRNLCRFCNARRGGINSGIARRERTAKALVDQATWLARVPVIVRQLRELRATYPA